MASKETTRLNPTGIRLRRSFEQFALKRMIDHLSNSDEKVEPICKLMHVYCELIRQDATADKTRPTARASDRTATPRDGRKVGDVRRNDIAALMRTVRDLYGVDLDKATVADSGNIVDEGRE